MTMAQKDWFTEFSCTHRINGRISLVFALKKWNIRESIKLVRPFELSISIVFSSAIQMGRCIKRSEYSFSCFLVEISSTMGRLLKFHHHQFFVPPWNIPELGRGYRNFLPPPPPLEAISMLITTDRVIFQLLKDFLNSARTAIFEAQFLMQSG